jgi:hypothetical protein
MQQETAGSSRQQQAAAATKAADKHEAVSETISGVVTTAAKTAKQLRDCSHHKEIYLFALSRPSAYSRSRVCVCLLQYISM